MLEGLEGLKPGRQVAQRPGLFSDAKATKAMLSNQKKAEAQAKKLKGRMGSALRKPTTNDPVYKVCQRIFHKDDSLVLSESNAHKCQQNRRAALRPFLQGYPPRKKNETSMGDAINWEWMFSCAIERKAELVIVIRDSDYGTGFDGQGFVNDYLRHEFSHRVSQKRQVCLFTKLSDALKLFKVTVTAAEAQEEELIAQPPSQPSRLMDLLATLDLNWGERKGIDSMGGIDLRSLRAAAGIGDITSLKAAAGIGDIANLKAAAGIGDITSLKAAAGVVSLQSLKSL